MFDSMCQKEILWSGKLTQNSQHWDISWQKLLDFKDKESFNLVLKVQLQGKKIRLTSDFHSNIQHLKTLEKCLKIPKDSMSQPRIFYLSKLASKYNDYRQTV